MICDLRLHVLTHSAMATAKTCLRKYQLRYEVGIDRDRTAQPLRMGSAFHLGLEARAAGKTLDEAVAIATAQYQEVPAWVRDDDGLHEWMTERETVATMLAGYYWRWQGDGIEVLCNEQSFSLSILNPETGCPSTYWRRCGKIDKVIRKADGRLAVMEHKTCSESIDPDSDYWKKLRIDHQISGYMDAAKRLGHDVEDVLYDVVRKPEIEPRLIPVLDENGMKIVMDQNGQRVLNKNGTPRQSASKEDGFVMSQRRETPAEFGARLLDDMGQRPDFYFARRDIPRLESDLADYRQELWDQAADLRERRRTGRYYRNTAACGLMGRCQYFDICTNGIDANRMDVPDGFVLLTDVHPEL